MLAGGASSAIFPVSATSDSDLEPDSSVQITTESGSGEDIELDGNLGGWDIKIDNSRKPDTKSDNDISVNGSGDGVTIKNNTESKKDDVKLEDAGDNNKPDAANKTGDAAKPADADADSKDIAITKPADTLSASITRTDKNNSLDVDDAATLHVEAKNGSENPAIFKMYFCDVREIKKGADLSTYLNKPALSCKVQGLSKACTLNVDVAGPDKKKTKSVMEFLKEVEKDEKSGSETVVSRYAKLIIPAGSSVDFDFSITSSKECAVTVIPVMVQETAVYGDAQSAEWEEEVTFFDHIVNFFTGKQPEKDDKDDEDIQISDVQGISADVPEGLNEDDFASKRLMVLSDDPSVFVGKNNVIGQYGDLYLMQFDTAEAAMQAYGYYKDIVTAVEPDISVEVASNVDAGDTENDVTLSNERESDAENDVTVNDVSADETEDTNPENNPINALNTVDASDVKKERGVIALIDTGVGEHANVIDRISVIDDNASGNGGSHGDAMVSAIVSQDPEAKILSIRAMDDNGYGTVSALVAAMEYAIEQKVSVINLSLYARTTLATSVLKSEIEKAVDAGIIVVGAAGNDGADVKDYMPGSVEPAYIIGAAGKGGYRQVLSNYGETVDYNVVAGSTSEASALFAGFVSANGLDGVDKVLNQGLIYATDYKKDFFDFVEGDFKDGKTVTVKSNGNVKVTVADVDAGVYHVYHVTDEKNTILVPEKEDVHIGVCTEDEAYSMESVDVLDADGNKIAEAEIKEHIRNAFFDVSGQELAHLDVKMTKQDSEVPIFDEISGVYYMESELCGDDCLREHIRRMPDGITADDLFHAAVPIPAGTGYPNYAGSDGYCSEGGHPGQTPVEVGGAVYEGTPPAACSDNLPFGNAIITSHFTNHGRSFFSLSFQDGPLAGGSVTNIACANHGLTSPEAGYGASATAYVESVDTVNKIIYLWIYFNTNINGFGGQNAYGKVWVRYEETQNDPVSIKLQAQKKWVGDADDLGVVQPDTVKVKIQHAFKTGGGSYGNWSNKTELTLKKSSGWKATTGLLPRIKWGKYDANGTWGEDNTGDVQRVYKYRIVEPNVPDGYEVSYKQFDMANCTDGCTRTATVTNTVKPIRIRLAVKKFWDDSNNGLGTRPASIKVKLEYSRKKDDGNWSSWTYKDDATLDASSHWTATWRKMPYVEGKYTYKYRVVEENVPANYKKNIIQFGYSSDENDLWNSIDPFADEGYWDMPDVSDDGETLRAKVTNTLEPGHLKLHKDSELPDMTDDNKCYSLKDAQYEVYTDSACTTKATYIGGPLKTDTDGDTDVITLLPGTYWVKEKGTGEKVGGKEKSYAKGFYVDTTAHKVTVKKEHTEDEPMTLNVKEDPMNDPLSISVQKIQKGPSNGNLPSLENAEFTVKYYDGFYDKSNVRSQTPTRVWVIKTKRVGSSNRYRTMLHEDYAVTGKCDEFYKAGTNVVIPLGTITVQETKPAPGYTLDGNGEFINLETGDIIMRDNEMYVAQIKDSTSGVFLSGGNEYTMENSTYPIHCRIEKLDGDGKKVAGVTYKIEYQQARDVYKKTTTVGRKTVTMLCDSTDDGAVLVARNTKNVYDKYGNLVGEQTTDSEGKAAFEDLYPDDYVITETSTRSGLQLLAEPIEVSLPMRMTKAEADEWNLDTSDTTKVQWSDSENRFIVLDATFKVTNHATFAMPMSGGTVNGWTFIPLVLGMGVFAGVVIVLFRKKKRAVKAE